MSTVDRARKTLQDAILSAHGLMSEALMQGDHSSLAVLTRLSEALAAVLSSIAPPEVGAITKPVGVARAARIAPAKGSPSKKTASSYPQFLRDGEKLVRLAWSKRERNEYEHKMPIGGVYVIAERLTSLGSAKKRFQVDALGEIAFDGKQIPSYQVYLCIAWLKASGLIQQHARSGYSVLAPHRLAEDARAALTKLADK